MREILFKAKRLDNGEWVEGYYMRHENRLLAPMGDTLKDEDVDHIILFSGFADWNMQRNIKYVKVDPSTVCEWTGLIDKNGTKVFEDDRLLDPHENIIFVVAYDPLETGFTLKDEIGRYVGVCRASYSKIIGSIHDGEGAQSEGIALE